ncbi:S9 family peptidase [Alteromonas pelagimontana]|uniref:S9 family peptidase n=1 Tax=Alteromonas pelagimontana TaxID=1858656 RepID=A0A6M4MBC5_9ALTE|nr:S9 family peptidase [Alteromonas pelagimontana]QJR80492.1 S9 family peptidase [Alteromonas pelagimontana]
MTGTLRRYRNAIIFTALSGTVAAVSVQAEEALPTTLQYQDTFNLEYAASPFFTPDSKTLIYERRSMDIMQDRTHTSLWQINLDNHQHRPLIATGANVSQATLSPDGTKLAFISDEEGSSQLYVQYLDNGQQAKLTNLTFSPGNLTWSGDSTQLAFTLFTPGKPASLFNDMPTKPDGAEWAKTAKFIEKTQYRSDGAGYLPEGFQQIYILPVAGGTPRQLTSGRYPNGGSLAFSKDNKAIYFSTDRREDYSLHPLDNDIFQVNIDSGKVTQVTDMAGPEASPLLSPNGKYLAFTQLNDRKLSYQNADLVVMNLSSGAVTRLTGDLDRAPGKFVWSNDSKELVFSYLDQGTSKLARVSLDGDIEKMDVAIGGQSLGRPYTSGDFAVSAKGTIVYTTDSTSRPADLAIVGRRGKPQTLTDLNSDALGHLNLAKVEELNVTSSVDQRSIGAWVALPPGFDAKKKYPLILEIHGGPHAAYGPHFSMEIQLMAAKGYVVVWSNPRGSASYGEDFGNLIHHNYPSEDYNDLMDVVDATIAKGYIDESNLFITGGSGGGVLTAWSVGKTDRFAAAVVAKPVINWMSFALTADAYPFFSQYWMPGMPWEIPDHLWKHSPLSLVGNVKTPTLLLTGESDYRTPISESEQFYQALRLQGVDAAMVRIPGASHGIAATPSRLIQKVGNILAWFERYKKKPDSQ